MPAPAPRRSALRLATVLFADLTNFTRAAEHADPEQIYLIIRATLERLAQSVNKLEGHIDRYVGDGFLATFGVPEAHEDDPHRALMAGLEMQESMIQLGIEASKKVNWNAQLRIGIHIGPVVSGQLDTGPLYDSSVFGHTVNLANRLQAAARPGTILVSEAIHQHTRTHFDFLEAVKLQLKGIDGPIAGYEVTGRRKSPEPIRGLSGRSTPLVGRSAEYETLRSALRRLHADRRGVIALITGEAGIGKSRLVREGLPTESEQVTVVYSECSPIGAGSYQLLKQTLSSLAGITVEQSPAERQQQIDALLSASPNLAGEIGPALSQLLVNQGAAFNASADPKLEQRRIYTATRRLLGWLARRRPVIIVLDDLHWADQSSIEALAHLADLVEEAPVALVGVARTAARDMLLAALGQVGAARGETVLDIRLATLPSAESAQLLNLLLPDVPLPQALLQNIVERANGIPLLIEEIVRMLLDHGIFAKTTDGWRVDPSWPDVVQKVPDTVNGLILNRYDRLPGELRRTLDVAAVFGSSFSLPELAAMTKAPEAELRAQLEQLEHADFVRRTHSARILRYSFRHPLMREAIYQTLLQSQRRSLHLEAAQVIQHAVGDPVTDSLGAMAYHLEQGGSPLAKSYLFQAATRAATQYANREAIDYYRRLTAQTDEDTRVHDAIDIALGLGELYTRTNQFDLARAGLDKADQLAQRAAAGGHRLGDICYRRGLLHANLGEYEEAVGRFRQAGEVLRQTPEHCRDFSISDVERELGWVKCYQFALDDAEQHARQALALATEEDNQQARGNACNLLAAVCFYAGRLADSVASAEEAMAIRERADDLWGTASAQTNLGTLYFKLGQWSKAESYLRQAIFVQQEVGDYHTLGISWNTLGLLLMEMGRFNEALQALEQALTIIDHHSGPPALARGIRLNRGLVHLRLGRLHEAVDDFNHSLTNHTEPGTERHRTYALALLAEAQLAGGNVGEAQSLLQQARALAQESPSDENLAEILRVQSYISRAGQLWDEGLKANREARAVFEKLGNRCEAARRQVEMADMILAQQEAGAIGSIEPDVANQLLGALQLFRKLDAQADIPQAERILARLTSNEDASAERRADFRHIVVVVNIHLRLMPLQEAAAEHSLPLAEALNSVAARLRNIGKEFGAVVANGRSGLAYVFSFAGVERPESLSLTPIHSATAVLEAAAEFNDVNRRQRQAEIPVSIGIVAGGWQSPIGDAKEAGAFISISQIGRRAETLARLAAANSILIGGDIVAAARPVYALEAIEYPRDKRLPGSVCRLGHVKSAARLTQKIPIATTQIVGRSDQLQALKGWVDKARSGATGWVCYLEAEAGMGKTRLVAETLAYARPHAVCVVGKCEPVRSGVSFWALVDMLEHTPLPDSPAARRLKSLLGLLAPDLDDELMMRNLPPTDLRQEIFGRVRSFLLELAKARPVLLVVEDIHWLDLSSLELFDFLLQITQEAPVSMMWVARAEMPGAHRSLISKAARVCQGRYVQVTFGGLSGAESLALARGLLKSATVPALLSEMIAPLAGHPLSVEEAIRYLVETGRLWQSGEHWRLTNAPPNVLAGQPTTYKDLLLGRLQAMENETLHVLQAAAVLGETLDRSVLGSIVPGPMLSPRLTELVERGWLVAPSPEAPKLYRFKHTLTRETIYNTLLASKRQLLHQRAAEALERLYPDSTEEYVELLAFHYGQGGLRDKSLHYALQAAEKSFARHALAESLSYYQQAGDALLSLARPDLRLLPAIELGLADVRLALGEPGVVINDLLAMLENQRAALTADTQGAALRRVGTALRQTGKLQPAWEYYQKARSLLRSWAENQRQLSPAELNRLNRELYGIELDIAHTLFDMRHTEQSKQQTDYFLERVDRHQFPDLVAQALNLKGGLAHREHDPQFAIRLVADSLAVYQGAGNRVGAAAAYSNLGILHIGLGQAEQAEDDFNRSLSLREALGDLRGLAITHNNQGQLYARRGKWPGALENLNAAVKLARAAEQNRVLAQAQANLSYVLCSLGRLDEALQTLADCHTLCLSYDFEDERCEVLWKRAECLVERNESEAALQTGTQALELAIRLGSTDLQSDAQRVLSRAHRSLGSYINAMQASAWAWERRSGDLDPLARARFAAEFGLALKACGHLEEAQRLYNEHVAPVQLLGSAAYQEEVRSGFAMG
ncbi:MAG: tetratricopeptide repeat protein [Chloroflexi bacterium]|nr:tetratricopeptide repeat protein [Chloroflexota bacterium]